MTQSLGVPSVVTVPAVSGRPSPASVVPDSGYYNRDALWETLMVRCTRKQDIIGLLGKPTQTQSFGTAGTENWYYNLITYDSIADKIDSLLQIVINGKDHVRSVNFYP